MGEKNIYKIDLGNTQGMSRKLDNLGRYVIPIEYREKLKIEPGDAMEAFLLKDGIFIKKKIK